MILKPLHDFVLIKADEVNESEAGIYIPDQADKEPINMGTVRSHAESVKIVKENDRVLFRPYLFEEVMIEGQKFLYGKENAIIALLV